MKIPPVLDSYADLNTYIRVLHYVIVDPLLLTYEGLLGLVGWLLNY